MDGATIREVFTIFGTIVVPGALGIFGLLRTHLWIRSMAGSRWWSRDLYIATFWMTRVLAAAFLVFALVSLVVRLF